jgi:hypothetical protein
MKTDTIYGTISLGSLIEKLGRCDPGARVYFDFSRLSPTSVNSYRGYYDHLAIGFADVQYDAAKKVGELLTELRSCVGKVFSGYQGGNYRMTEQTPVWVGNWGESTDTVIVGVLREGDYAAVILTRNENDGSDNLV